MYLVQSAVNPSAASGRLNLEQIYSTCLEKILEGEPLAKVLTLYLHVLEQTTQGYRFAVLQNVQDKATLSLLTAPSLPEAFLKHIQHMRINEKHTACSQAVSSLRPVFIDNLAAHPYWQDCSSTLAVAGITSYWSFPLLDSESCIGTLLITASQKRIPDAYTLSHYESVAAHITRVFSYCNQQQGRTSINWTLQMQLSQTQQALDHLQQEHDRLTVRHQQTEAQLVHQPLPKSFQRMAQSLIDEINALLEVVDTTLTFQRVLTEQNRHCVSLKQLSKTGLNQFYHSMIRSGCSGVDMLGQARERIKELADYIEMMTTNPLQTLPVSITICTINSIIADALRHLTITPCLDIDANLMVSLPTGCFTQLLSELLLNIYQHAYPNANNGKLWITARSHDIGGVSALQLILEDAGQGIPRTVQQRLAGVNIKSSDNIPKSSGLERCQRLVKAGLNGNMYVQPRRGGGARIVLTLPHHQ